ncbi:metallophosphoesterase [Candidatus Woesearchaeota archaeon]|nr:MAG: metallophosphoesterase [Candidatus Woesearchaeota archaeon]
MFYVGIRNFLKIFSISQSFNIMLGLLLGMEIISGVEIKDLALYIKADKTLIIGDLQLGYEESLHKKGVLVPKFQFKDTISRLQKIIKENKPDKIIINGDVKHEFGTISEQEWREILHLIDFLREKSLEIVFVKGNHDKILEPIVKKRNVKITPFARIRDILIIHGHEIPESTRGVKTIIIGHEHPAISLRDGSRVETFKCFLKGEWKRKNLIVQPSFNPLAEGSDVLSEKLLSPLLADSNIDNFEVFVVADKTRYFGTVAKLRQV